MNSIIKITFLLFISTGIKAQSNTTYYTESHKKLDYSDRKDAAYYELNSGEERNGKIDQFFTNHKPYGNANYNNNELHGNYVKFYPNGKIKESGLFDSGKQVGLKKRRYSNGLMRSIELMKDLVYPHQPKIVSAWDSSGEIMVSEGNGSYQNGLFDNPAITEMGQVTNGLHTGLWAAKDSDRTLYEDTYNDQGELVSGISYDDAGQPYAYTEFEEDAVYKNGMEDWNRHLRRHLKYPTAAKRAGEQGEVYISFTIAKDGRIEDSVVTRGVSLACNKEALRVLNLSKIWTPGKQRGQPVVQRMNLRVVFRLK